MIRKSKLVCRASLEFFSVVDRGERENHQKTVSEDKKQVAKKEYMDTKKPRMAGWQCDENCLKSLRK